MTLLSRSGSPARPLLLMPRDKARQHLLAQIDKGKQIAENSATSEPDEAAGSLDRWFRFCCQLLMQMFTTDSALGEFRGARPARAERVQARSGAERHPDPAEHVQAQCLAYVGSLESLLDLLEVVPLDPGVSESTPCAELPQPLGHEVFIVHGRDNEALETVARFIQILGLKPIILREQPGAGRTIIEKLEHYSDVAFAVVIMAPDDEGHLRGSDDDLKPRARQNVILELGLFIGKFGRARVCPLVKGDVDTPSDYRGVEYVEMDDGGGWKLKLAQEMNAGGMDFDMNKTVR